jgi:hypothetical protein
MRRENLGNSNQPYFTGDSRLSGPGVVASGLVGESEVFVGGFSGGTPICLRPGVRQPPSVAVLSEYHRGHE